MKRISLSTKKGMTMVELIVVVAIIVIVLGAVIGISVYNLNKASDFVGMLG